MGVKILDDLIAKLKGGRGSRWDDVISNDDPKDLSNEYQEGVTPITDINPGMEDDGYSERREDEMRDVGIDPNEIDRIEGKEDKYSNAGNIQFKSSFANPDDEDKDELFDKPDKKKKWDDIIPDDDLPF